MSLGRTGSCAVVLLCVCVVAPAQIPPSQTPQKPATPPDFSSYLANVKQTSPMTNELSRASALVGEHRTQQRTLRQHRDRPSHQGHPAPVDGACASAQPLPPTSKIDVRPGEEMT